YEMIWNVIGAIVIVFLIENSVRLVKSTPWSENWPNAFLSRTDVVTDQWRPWAALGLPSIRLTRRPQWQWGKTFGLYLIWYGIGGPWSESTRLDPSEPFPGIRSSVGGAPAAIVLGIVIIVVQPRRHPGVEPSPYQPGREWKDPAEVDSEDTYSDTDDSGD